MRCVGRPLFFGGADEPTVRKITTTDVWEALAQGFDDFRAIPTHAFFICLIYPVAGLVLYRLSFGYEMLPLLYPIVAGFALLGPFIAIGLYELSRRREQDPNVSPMRAFDVMHRPSFGAICRLGLLLAAIFVAWLYAANLIYLQIFGNAVPPPAEFINQVTTTAKGTQLIIVGNVVGFLFAAFVLVISVVSFPMLVDRNVSAATAVRTSVRAAIENPIPIALWGLDRRLFAVDRSGAAAGRTGDRSARPRARDVAPLPEARRARIKSACSYSAPRLGRRRMQGTSQHDAGHRAEEQRSFRDTKEKYQPACKPGSVWRLPSATAIHLGRLSPSASCNQPGWVA